MTILSAKGSSSDRAGLALLAFLTTASLFAVDPPLAYGPVPSARQLVW
jgi:hypothetical protein